MPNKSVLKIMFSKEKVDTILVIFPKLNSEKFYQHYDPRRDYKYLAIN